MLGTKVRRLVRLVVAPLFVIVLIVFFAALRGLQNERQSQRFEFCSVSHCKLCFRKGSAVGHGLCDSRLDWTCPNSWRGHTLSLYQFNIHLENSTSVRWTNSVCDRGDASTILCL